jgi:hypothetical protein
MFSPFWAGVWCIELGFTGGHRDRNRVSHHPKDFIPEEE